ncbi:MAG: hypothetical protein MJZ61_06490 [Bacteroidales bacterium]|nr:hypothetical protein [Bacteroidales bacterium]
MRKTALLILLLCGGIQAFAQESTPLEKDLSYAEYLVNNQRRELAYSKINEIIKQHANCSQAYYLRASNYLEDGNDKAAMKDINRALQYNSQNATYLALKSMILYKQGKTESAGEIMEQALRRDSQTILGNTQRRLNIAEILVTSGNTIDAFPIINSVENHDGNFYRVRGMAYAYGNMNTYAINDLSKALDMDPHLEDTYIWRGMAKYNNGDRDGALNDWNTAIKRGLYKAKEFIEKYK